MHNHLLKYFSDILCAISEIESFLTIKGRRFDIFISDMMFYKSILMDIAIIGEAMNNILKIQPDIEISNARK